MKTPTTEEMNLLALVASDAAIARISAGAVRRCIPAQVDDDDVTLCAIVEEWKRRGGALAAAGEALRKFATHEWPCDAWLPRGPADDPRCTCGLRQAVEAVRAAAPGREVVRG